MATFWEVYGGDLQALGIYAAGIMIYGLIVNLFYQVISKRVMFGKKDARGNVHVGGPGRGFVYLIAFPLVSLGFFLMLSMSLLFLGGEGKEPLDVFTVAMAIVAAVRVAAYFSEPTAHDVAKMLPLGLLGFFIVTGEFDNLRQSFANMWAIFDHLQLLAVYFGVVVVLEYVLRLLYIAFRVPPKKKGKMVTPKPIKGTPNSPSIQQGVAWDSPRDPNNPYRR